MRRADHLGSLRPDPKNISRMCSPDSRLTHFNSTRDSSTGWRHRKITITTLYLSFAALKTLLIVEVKQRCPESTFGWGAGIFFVKNPQDVAVNESRRPPRLVKVHKPPRTFTSVPGPLRLHSGGVHAPSHKLYR
jgi:hypothetical protein